MGLKWPAPVTPLTVRGRSSRPIMPIMKVLRKIGYLLAWWGLAGVLGGVLLCTGAYLYLEPKLPAASSYRNIRLQNPLRIYSADEKLIAEFGSIRRDPIKYEDIPPQLI